MEVYISIAFLSALLSVVLAHQIYRLDVNKKYHSFIPVVFSTGIWAFFSGLWLLLPGTWSIVASKLSYAGIIALPVFLFLFALDYAGSTWLQWFRARRWLLWILPGISAAFIATNTYHGFFWKDIQPVQVIQDVVVYKFFPNFWFTVHSIYSYGLVAASAVILLLAMRRKKAIASQYMLLTGILLPMTASILFVMDVTVLDYSPLLLSLAIIFFALAISQGFYLDNISKIHTLQKKTTEINRLYHMVVRVSERLIQSEPEHIDNAINEVMRLLGEVTNVDRTYLFLYDEESDEVSNTHEWCREGIPSEKDNLQNIPFSEAVPRWRKVLMSKDYIYIPVVKDLPEDAIYVDEKAILEPQGIQSLIVVPLFSGRHFAGFAGFDSVRNTREWNEESIALLTLAASIIAGSLDRVSYENELIRARDKAEEASKVKTEFLANMSHELRTPLNAIMGFTEIVADELPGGENREHLELANKSSEALLQLINDLLDFSKAEAGILSIEPVETDVEELLGFVKDTFLPGAREKNLDLQVKVEPGACKNFILDKARLRQVLFNLAGNAVKFTHEGHVKITAEAEPVNKDTPGSASLSSDAASQASEDVAGSSDNSEQWLAGDETPETRPSQVDDSYITSGSTEKARSESNFVPHRLTITVEDTGIGIREEDQEAIFKEFIQLSSGDSRQYDGTGLGLNIAQRLVSLMGGEITVTSRLGEGSRFTVTLHNLQAATG